MNRSIESITVSHEVTTFSLSYYTDNPQMIHSLELKNSAQPTIPLEYFPQIIHEYVERIKNFLKGAKNSLIDIIVDLDRFTPFTQKVLQMTRQIPWGETISYKDLALRCDSPSAMRAVGSVLKKNPFPLIIPCHRVIQSSGKIGGFQGCMDGDSVMLKRKLLSLEGIDL